MKHNNNENSWIHHVKMWRKTHPNQSLKDSLQKAKSSYHQKKTVKKAHECKKRLKTNKKSVSTLCTKKELVQQAKKLGVKGADKLTKDQLVSRIRYRLN